MSKSWEQILGGYATDTLTEEEKRQLFEAALHDQTLFDTLADEEALKVLLADPDAHQRVLASLQTSGEPQGGALSSRSGLSWFRQPSSLAWVGGIAAMGLALIFGWQMEKNWGPMVQQEQEAERSLSENKARDKNREVFRSQEAQLEDKKSVVALTKKDESPLPSELKPQSVPVPMPEADTDRAKSVDRLEQVQEGFKKERRVKEEGQDSSSSGMRDQMSQAQDTLLAQEQPQVEQMVEPLVMPDAAEVAKPAAAKLSPARERLAGQAAMDEPLSPPGALDRFYASFGAGDPDGRTAGANAGNAILEKASSESSTPKAKEEKSVSIKGEMTEGEGVIQRAKGIRYSFIRETENDEEELAEEQQITGDWRDIRLAIEPNEAGFLYVFAPLGNGKWQQLEQVTVLEQGDNPDGDSVKAYQIVEFRLGVITNIRGKLVISSITVLFSPTPLENFGKWVGSNANMSELQIERTDDSVYVVRPGISSDALLRVDIPLEE